MAQHVEHYPGEAFGHIRLPVSDEWCRALRIQLISLFGVMRRLARVHHTPPDNNNVRKMAMKRLHLPLLWLVALLALSGCKKIESVVTVSYEGEGRITEGRKIDCGDTCSAPYFHYNLMGTVLKTPDYNITLSATPAAGHEFFTWQRNCGASTQCTLRIETGCGSMPPLGYPCLDFVGNPRSAHAVFVPAGSVVQEYRHGTSQNCLLDTSGVLKCWGVSGNTVLAVPDPVDVQLTALLGCARSGSENRLYCWGSTAISQVPALENPGPFVLKDRFACAIAQGQVHCWGDVPVGIANRIPALNNPVALWADNNNLCVQDSNGDHCWGNELIGQSKPPALNGAFAISASGRGTCALTADGLRCWGFPAGGSTLDGNFVNASSLDLSDGHSCVGDDAGMHCYWNNFTLFNLAPELQDSRRAKWVDYNICGLDDNGLDCWYWLGYLRQPYHVDALAQVDDFDVARAGACAIGGRTLACWGNSDFWPYMDAPIRTLTLQQPRVISIRDAALCVGGADGLECRYKDSTTALATRQPTGLRGITALEITDRNGCALHESGVSCWGSNAFGVENVPALQNPRAIALGDFHACALDDSGVKCWGEKLPRPE
jgi:hypothetical protein